MGEQSFEKRHPEALYYFFKIDADDAKNVILSQGFLTRKFRRWFQCLSWGVRPKYIRILPPEKLLVAVSASLAVHLHGEAPEHMIEHAVAAGERLDYETALDFAFLYVRENIPTGKPTEIFTRVGGHAGSSLRYLAAARKFEQMLEAGDGYGKF